MEHRALDDRAPGPGTGPAAGPVAGQRARAAGTADPGVTGDAHVAGPGPRPPVTAVPGPVPDTAPDPFPATPPAGPPPGSPAGTAERLLDPAEAGRFRERWHEVQSAFVDDPGESVRRADDLASDAVDALGRAIATHRRTLTQALEHDGHADTERLRLALRDYRRLLDRIFAA